MKHVTAINKMFMNGDVLYVYVDRAVHTICGAFYTVQCTTIHSSKVSRIITF